jgi:putative FmdB family regulatory protein
MPMYEYNCPECNRQKEVFLRIADIDKLVYCVCGCCMSRIIVGGYSHGDSPWIRDANEALTDEFMPQIETRSDLHKRMKELGVEHAA